MCVFFKLNNRRIGCAGTARSISYVVTVAALVPEFELQAVMSTPATIVHKNSFFISGCYSINPLPIFLFYSGL
jgi:hypothetical protein